MQLKQEKVQIRWVTPGVFAMLVLVTVACSSKAPPPPPTLSSSGTSVENDSSSASDDDLSASDSSTSAAASPYNYGGADIGDVKSEMSSCHDKGQFFDRTTGDLGTCSELKLAKMDCTIDGVKSQLTGTTQQQFQGLLDGDYQGWTIDQCADCPPGNSDPICKSTGGDQQTGTKIFFAKEQDAQISIKAMLIHIRPNQ